MPDPSPNLVKSICEKTNPGFDADAARWVRDEELYRAEADRIREHLAPFTWETAAVASPDVAGLALRRDRIIYVPFAQMRGEAFIGTVFQRAPKPGEGITFGGLGELGDTGPEGRTIPTRAQQLVDAADGTGKDALGLLGFFEAAMGLASATDYRWIRVDAPRAAPGSRREEAEAALRPFFVEHGPQHVPYTIFENGTLRAARVLIAESVRKVEGDVYTDEEEVQHLLVVRAGFKDWGPDFEGGGWWRVDDEGQVKDSGTWDRTLGEIPMYRLSYKRSPNSNPLPCGATWLNNLSLAHMDAGSWHWNDLHVSGGRKRYWLGADPGMWEEMVKQALNGGVEVPVPGRADGGEVKVYDTGEITVGPALKEYQEDRVALAARYFLREVMESPDASGVSKVVDEMKGRSPLLAHVAANLEDGMWTGLRFIEQVWTGGTPSSDVTWPRDFDLRSVQQKVAELFGLFSENKLTVPASLGAALLRTAVEGSGLVAGDSVDMEAVEEDIRGQLGAAVTTVVSEAAIAGRRAQPPGTRVAALQAAMGGDGATGEPVVE